MIRFKGHRRTCWEEDCGGTLAIVHFERDTVREIQGKLRCQKCGADSIVFGVNCERVPGDQIEEPPFPLWGSKTTKSADLVAKGVDPEIAELHAQASIDLHALPGEELKKRLDEAEHTHDSPDSAESAEPSRPADAPSRDDASVEDAPAGQRLLGYAQSPIKRWVGGKAALLDAIFPLVPTSFGIYFEPFLGSGAVAFALLGMRRDGVLSFDGAVLADTNRRLIRALWGIRDNVEQVIAGLAETKELYEANPESTYENARAMTYVDAHHPFLIDLRDDVTVAVWFLFVNAVCFNGVYRENAKGEFNVPLGKTGKSQFGNSRSLPFTFDETRLREASELLQSPGVLLWNKPWDETLPLGTASEADVCYLDPPYAALSETAEFGTKKGGYGNADGFDRDQQLMLAGVAGGLASRGATVIASNASTMGEVYAKAGFTIETVDRKGTVSSKGSGRGRVAEMLASNVKREPMRWPADATSTEPPKQRTRMPKKKSELMSDPLLPPPVTIAHVISNVKTDRMDAAWRYEFSGSKILVVGENAAGKSRLLNAIELAISGRATDVVLRDPALPAELLNLAPPGAGMLSAAVGFSDGTEATFAMPIAVVKGERKASRAMQTPTAATLPMRILEEAITGSADKARAFFLTAIENQTTDSDVIALLPALWHEMWTRATTGTAAGLSSPQKVLALIDTTRSQQRKYRDDAKVNATLVEQLGERMAGGMPTEGAIQLAKDKVTDIDRQLAEIDALERFAAVVTARQQLAAAQAELGALPPVDPNHERNQRVLAAVGTVLGVAHEAGMTSCPICRAAVTPETFPAALADLQAVQQEQNQKRATDVANERTRHGLEEQIRRLVNIAIPSEPIPDVTTTTSALVDPKARRAELWQSRAAALAELQKLELLRARWDDVIKARDRVALAEREYTVWAQFEKALVEARDMLVRRAVMSFENRVNLFLPEGDSFGLRLSDDTGREVFQLGLWRNVEHQATETATSTMRVFHCALAGSELTRVLCAVASVLSQEQQVPAVIIPRERMITKKRMGPMLKALADAPGIIILTTGENPGDRATKGWCVIDVDAVQSSRANGKHVDAEAGDLRSAEGGTGTTEHEPVVEPPVREPAAPIVSPSSIFGGHLGGSLDSPLGRPLSGPLGTTDNEH